MKDYNLLYASWNTKDLYDQLYFLEKQTFTTINHYRICAIIKTLKTR